jgi:CubicO group peptidase (beta-lactamase class C family)
MQLRKIVLVFCCLVGAISLFAQSPELPDTPVGKLVAAYLKAFNSGDDKVMTEYFTNYLAKSVLPKAPMAERLKRYRNMYDELQGLEFQRVLDTGSNSIKVLAKTKGGGRVSLSFELEPQPPHGQLGLRIEEYEGSDDKEEKTASAPTTVPLQADQRAVVEGELGAKLDAEASKAAESGFTGAVLVAKGGKILLHKGYGWANRERKIPIKTDTVFDIGSIAKRFTAVAIVKLEEQGKLSLNDALPKFFNNVPPDKTGITIQHLLKHTSGLDEYHDTQGDFEAMAKDAALQRIFAQRLKFTPGQQEAYSNSGYTLLAMIVERVSSKLFQAFLQAQLFNPAGMSDTGFYRNPRWQDEKVARGYNALKTVGQNSPLTWPEVTWALLGAGGVGLTPADLYKWHLKMKGTEVLSAAARQKYFASDPLNGIAGGNDFGFFAIYFEYPKEDAVVIIMSNTGSPPRVMGLQGKLASLIVKAPQPIGGQRMITTGPSTGAVTVREGASEETSPPGAVFIPEVAPQTETGKLPETPAGRLVAAYLKAFNSGNEQVYREFITNYFAKSALGQVPMEERLRRFREIQSRLGGYELQRLLKEETGSIQVLAKTKQGELVELIFELEPQPPHGLLGLRIEQHDGTGNTSTAGAVVVRRGPNEEKASAPAKTTVAVKADAAEKIEQYLTRLTPFGFSGSVLVAQGDRVLFNQAYGMADRAKGLANTPETLFDTGSVAKQFTAAAIFKLESLGKLNSRDPISKYLDGVPADKQAITIYQLLAHTSGVMTAQNIYAGDNFSDRDKRMRQILDAPLLFKPGERYDYSNAGYNLAAAIIEKVSGQSYQQFLYENLFKPAGMTSTLFQAGRFAIPGADKKTVARLYAGMRDNGLPLGRDNFAWFFTGPGGILTTTGDFFKWHQALNGDKALSAEAKQRYYELAATIGTMRDTAYGRLVSHGGGTTMGTGATFARYLDAGVMIATCLNNSGEEFNQIITRGVTAAVFGGDLRIPPVVIAITPTALAKVIGTYELASGGSLLVTAVGGQLQLAAEDSKALEAVFETQPSARNKQLEERTLSLVEASLKGDYEPLRQAMISPLATERLAAREQKTWQEWRSKYGDLKDFTLIGTTPEPMNDAAVNVRFNFERGSIFTQYVWFPRGLDGVRVLSGPPIKAFLPAAETEFVSYHLQTGNVVRVVFGLDSQGAVNGLTLHTKSGAAQASRLK